MHNSSNKACENISSTSGICDCEYICSRGLDPKSQTKEAKTAEKKAKAKRVRPGMSHLGIRSDRTDRFGSSIIRSVRSSETWDRSVFAKNKDRGSSVSVSSVRSRSRPN